MLNLCHFYVGIRELHCMHSNCNNALCNTLFSKIFIASAIVQYALLSIVQHVPIPCIHCC